MNDGRKKSWDELLESAAAKVALGFRAFPSDEPRELTIGVGYSDGSRDWIPVMSLKSYLGTYREWIHPTVRHEAILMINCGSALSDLSTHADRCSDCAARQVLGS